MIILLTVGLIKGICYIKMSYFPELHTNRNKIELELDLSNYATKSDLKTQKTLIYFNLPKKMIQLT